MLHPEVSQELSPPSVAAIAVLDGTAVLLVRFGFLFAGYDAREGGKHSRVLLLCVDFEVAFVPRTENRRSDTLRDTLRPILHSEKNAIIILVLII